MVAGASLLAGVVVLAPVDGDGIGSTRASAQASDSCGDVVPWLAFAGSTFGDGATGALGVGTLTGSSTAAAGGATLAGASIATFGAAVAGFFGASAATCAVLDVLVGEAATINTDSSFVSTSNIEVGERAACSNWAAYGSQVAHGISSGTYTMDWCRQVMLSSPVSCATECVMMMPTSTTAVTRAGVTISAPSDADNAYGGYGPTHSSWSALNRLEYLGRNGANCPIVTHGGSYASGCIDNNFPLGGTWPIVLEFNCYGNMAPAGVMVPGADNANGVGGVCGYHPHHIAAVVNRTNTAEPFHAFVHPMPEAREYGWQREFIWDVKCQPGTVAEPLDDYWVRTISGAYWDAVPNVRPTRPMCQEGDLAVQYQLWRQPLNIVRPALGAEPVRQQWIISEWAAPSTFTAAAPDWTFCLRNGSDCGAPALDSLVCVWGGFTVSGDFCDPALQTSPESVPGLAPRLTTSATVAGVTTQLGEVLSTVDPVTTGEPPPGDGDSDTITVPIDPGGGLGSGDPDDGEAECWPSGWGWFNPGQWVLRPIKCAMEWAFVPDEAAISAAFDSFSEELESQFPFSLLFMAGDFLGDIGDALSSPGGSGCWGGATSWSFGDYGSVAGDDVCVASLPVGSGQRATVFVLMLAPMVWAILRHGWGIVAGGNRGKDDES
jgi:hypothetical protein